jgi:hypothetical protein
MSTQFNDTKRTLTTGDVVISVAEIFDRLQTKVDPNTLEQLLRDILAGRRSQVRPGELITAELINQILAELESLQVRVTKLEAGVVNPIPVSTPVDITDLLPHGPLHVGDELTIVGKNFLSPAENNTVSVAGVQINPSLFKFSSDNAHLIFDIPPVPGLASISQPVLVQVSNKNGSDSASLTLLPAFHPPTGRLEVAYAVAPVMPDMPPEARNIQANNSYLFVYSITAFVAADATDVIYQVTPTMAGWNPKLLTDNGSQPADTNLIKIPAGISGVRRDIRVQVTAPAGGGKGTLQIGVVETSGFGKVTPGNAINEISVGSPPPTPEDRVRVSIKSLVPSPAAIVGNKAQWKRGSPGALTMVFSVIPKGIYQAQAEFRLPDGWRAADGSTPKLSISNFEVPNEATRENPARVDSILILSPTAAAADTDLIVTVSSVSGVATPVNVKYAQAVGVVD